MDSDDDRDGTPTSKEVKADGKGEVEFPDTNHDNPPDYLDSQIAGIEEHSNKINIAIWGIVALAAALIANKLILKKSKKSKKNIKEERDLEKIMLSHKK